MERQADHDALRAALDGEYLHVIAPRQVGKTSLLKHLAARLGEMGWRCVYVDLSTLMDFHKPSWYAELGKALARSLTPGRAPTLANQVDLRHYLLDQALPWSTGQPRVALLLDEVEGAGKARDTDDKPFSDTFFSMFRALYNERDKINGTIVVALAGAVNPGDLVKDPDISPFNVGQEIGLNDFTPTETRALTEHLGHLELLVDEAAHQAIHDWSNGHPYLTQRICAELEKIVRDGGLTAITPDNVGDVVEQVILNPINPFQRDKNLRHVAKMLSSLSAQATQLWSQLRAGESISRREATDDLYLELYLTGAVKTQAGHFIIRNRIYEREFVEKIGTEPPAAVGPKPRSTAMVKTIRVFISSTWHDLQPEREAVEKALHRMQDAAFAGMEYFGSRPETPKEVSLAEVDRSDVYIGIFAHRYGSGITEAEYRRARERNIPCLIYLKDDSVPVPPAHIERDPERIARLDNLKRGLKAHHTVSSFKSPDHLATQVVTDLHNLLGSAPSTREEKLMQPRLNSWTNDQKVQIVLDYRRTGIVRCPLDGAMVHVIDAGAGDTPYDIIVDCPICRNTFESSEIEDLVKTTASRLIDVQPIETLRLQDLADNVHQDLALLKDYEDALRYEDGPRRRARYHREIEQLRDSATRYQQEYEQLRVQVTGEPSVAMQVMATQLRRMDTKLDELLAGQTAIQEDLGELRQAVLARFDTSEQAIIANVVERLDQAQLVTVQAVLDAIEAERVQESQLQETLTTVQETLAEIQQRGTAFFDPALVDGAARLSEVVDAPKLDVKHKLKVTLPIIPMILSYEGEVELKSGLNLEAAWQRLVSKVRGER